MKRFFLVLLVVAFLPVTKVNAQMVVAFDALTQIAFERTLAEKILYWGQQVSHWKAEIEHFAAQVEHMGKQFDAQVRNLQNIKNIKSWDDFMDWHNRQLYLERRTEETWNNMNVTIGKKNYNITDVEGMAYGFQDTYINYWNKKFTEEQRREMWTELGLTPSNYAYIKTWREREREIAREFLAARAIHAEEYDKNMEANKKNVDAINEDKEKDDDDPTKMGDKGIAVINAETNIASNKVLNDIHGDLVDIKEKMAVDMYQNRTPVDEPAMSQWPADAIQPLKK